MSCRNNENNLPRNVVAASGSCVPSVFVQSLTFGSNHPHLLPLAASKQCNEWRVAVSQERGTRGSEASGVHLEESCVHAELRRRACHPLRTPSKRLETSGHLETDTKHSDSDKNHNRFIAQSAILNRHNILKISFWPKRVGNRQFSHCMFSGFLNPQPDFRCYKKLVVDHGANALRAPHIAIA